VRLFYIGGEVYYSLSAMTGFFLLVMIVAAQRMYRSSSDALALSYRNEELIQNLIDIGEAPNLSKAKCKEIQRRFRDLETSLAVFLISDDFDGSLDELRDAIKFQLDAAGSDSNGGTASKDAAYEAMFARKKRLILASR